MKTLYSQKASKQYKKLSSNNQKKIFHRITALKKQPLLGKKLKGQYKSLYSYRAWPYRLIYQYSKKQKTIIIVTIDHRQAAYK